jgi:hemerythrin-like domain-containing protein
MHHGIEDEAMFPGLVRREPSLEPVVERLMADHELVAEVLVALDQSLVTLVDGGRDVEAVRDRAIELSDLLLPHLAYEEEQLLPVIARLTDRVI